MDSFFEFLSDSFRPILGALLGASLFITFMALMSTLESDLQEGTDLTGKRIGFFAYGSGSKSKVLMTARD